LDDLQRGQIINLGLFNVINILLFSQTNFICPIIFFVTVNTVPRIVIYRQECVS